MVSQNFNIGIFSTHAGKIEPNLGKNGDIWDIPPIEHLAA
jgi:hypothetical protein